MRAPHIGVIAAAIALGAPAMAARNPSQDRLEAFYGDDAEAARKVRVEEMMGLYSVLPPMRHPSEKVDLRPGQVRLNLWHPVGRLSDAEIVTQAVKWFVFGRTRYATGVRGIFSEMSDVREVLLIFHEVIRPEETGRRRAKRKEQLKPYLAIKLNRRGFRSLEVEALRACVEAGDCSAQFRRAFSAARFDRGYARKARQDDD